MINNQKHDTQERQLRLRLERGSQEKLLHEEQALRKGEESYTESYKDQPDDEPHERLKQELLQIEEQQRAVN